MVDLFCVLNCHYSSVWVCKCSAFGELGSTGALIYNAAKLDAEYLMRALMIISAVLSLMPLAARAEPELPIVVVMNIEPVGLEMSSVTMDRLSVLLTGHLGSTGKYQVVPREQVKTRLVELKTESHRECYAESCQIALGQSLAAQKTVATQVIKAGSYCSVSMSLFDLKVEATEKGAFVDGTCDEQGIVASLKTAVDQLTGTAKIVRSEGVASGAVAFVPPPEVEESAPQISKAAVKEASGELIVQARSPGDVPVRLEITDPSGKMIASGSPYKNHGAQIGVWKVVAKASGHERDEQSVLVRADDTSMLKIVMKPFGSLKIIGEPAGAEVTVAGPEGFKDTGGLPWKAEGLKAGSYKITVSRTGYVAQSRDVKVEPGTEASASITLERNKEGSAASSVAVDDGWVTIQGYNKDRRNPGPVKCPSGVVYVIRGDKAKSFSGHDAAVAAAAAVKDRDILRFCPGRHTVSKTVEIQWRSQVQIVGYRATIEAQTDRTIMSISNSSRVDVSGVQLVHKIADPCSSICLSVSGSSEISVSDCDLNGSGEVGIRLSGVSLARIVNNLFHDCTYGFSAYSSQNLIVEGNKFFDNRKSNIGWSSTTFKGDPMLSNTFKKALFE